MTADTPTRDPSSNRLILGAAVTTGLFTVLARLVALGRELVMAHEFGTGPELDAFLLAWTLVTFLGVLLGGAFGPGFMTEYVRALRADAARDRDGNGHAADGRDGTAAGRLLRGVLVPGLWLVLGGTLLVGALAPFLPQWLGTLDPVRTRELAWLMLPVLALTAIRTGLGSVLTAHRRFALPAVVVGVAPGLAILVMLLQPTAWGVTGLAAAVTVGVALEVLILVAALRRHHPRLAPSREAARDPAVRRVMHEYRLLIFGAGIWSTAPLVDTAMAATLGDGAVSTLNYGTRIVLAATGLGVTALATAVLPRFSALVADDRRDELAATLRTWVRIAAAATLAVALALMLLALPVTRLLYEHGAFTPADSARVAVVQVASALQIPVYTVGMLLVRVLQADQQNRFLARLALVNFAVNIAGNWLLMQWLGVAGIALSTAVVYTVSFLLLAIVVRRRL